VRKTSPWQTLSSRVAYENAWIRVREDQVLRPDGSPGIYGVLEMRPSMGVIALNERDEIVLVGQWRYPQDAYSWEIPRGGSAPHETDLLAVAKRELREETGVVARSWHSLGVVNLGNGISNEVEHLFVATGIELFDAAPEPDEEIAVRWVPFNQALEMAMSGEISECCSIAAILKYALLRIRNENEECDGGRRGARTPDPGIANAVLSQLS
jgi:8-oxo-dGTP pyrophosphatase MutT (NUDIX family)